MALKGCGYVFGAQGRNRTTDTVIFSHVLYQLSYLGFARPQRGLRPYRGVRLQMSSDGGRDLSIAKDMSDADEAKGA